MILVKPEFFIESTINGLEVIKLLEKAGRVCYKSEENITKDSGFEFVKKVISDEQETFIEHFSVTVRVICDRGVTHEIVRHRLASYSQESTRYCNYGNDQFNNQVTFIKPSFWNLKTRLGKEKYDIWKETMEFIESKYLKLIELGATPQEARSILPNSLKTEIVMTMNLRQWRHFFKLRTSEASHPQMREIAMPMLNKFKHIIPVVFDDINP